MVSKQILFLLSIFLNVSIHVNSTLNSTQVSLQLTNVNQTFLSRNTTVVTKAINFSRTNEVIHDKIVKSLPERPRMTRKTYSCNSSSDCKDSKMICKNSICVIKCNTTSDCEDPRMVCTNKTCACARFHFRDHYTKECTPNISRIIMWLKRSASSESEAESQGTAFKVTQTEPYTILVPIWTEYKGSKEAGLGVVPKPVWLIIICICSMLLIYALILFDFF